MRYLAGKKSIVVLGLGFLVAAAGCSNQESTIAQIPPYVGGRPGGVRPVKPPPAVVQAKPVQSLVTGEAAWMPTGGISNRWKYIVIHHSANNRDTPEKIRDWHVRGRGWDELGYHFVIGNGVAYGDGQIYVGNRWKKQMHGAHCKTPGNEYNDHGIGICLIGDFQTSRPTQKQMASLARLVSFLTQKTGIPESRIKTHGGITHKTACPGRNFSLAPLLRQVSQYRAAR